MPVPIVIEKSPNMDAPTAYGDPGVYKYLTAPIVLTANLPAASEAMNGRILIEDAGSGDINLILYAHGERYRINGGSNV